MDKLEIKQGSFIQQTQYFIPVEINDFYRICSSYRHVWESLIFSLVPSDNRNIRFTCPTYFHWYRTNVNVEAWWHGNWLSKTNTTNPTSYANPLLSYFWRKFHSRKKICDRWLIFPAAGLNWKHCMKKVAWRL